MILCFFFLFLFAGLALLTSFLVITSKNPIYSVLFLIVSFCNISALLLLLKFEFLPVVLIIVYVGAIAVLFLFVLMTLNLKIAETKRQTASYTPFLVLLALLFFFQVVSLTRVELSTILIELKQLYVFSDLTNGSVNFSSFCNAWRNYSNFAEALCFQISKCLLSSYTQF